MCRTYIVWRRFVLEPLTHRTTHLLLRHHGVVSKGVSGFCSGRSTDISAKDLLPHFALLPCNVHSISWSVHVPLKHFQSNALVSFSILIRFLTFSVVSQWACFGGITPSGWFRKDFTQWNPSALKSASTEGSWLFLFMPAYLYLYSERPKNQGHRGPPPWPCFCPTRLTALGFICTTCQIFVGSCQILSDLSFGLFCFRHL